MPLFSKKKEKIIDEKSIKRQQDIDLLLVLNSITDSISCQPTTKQKAEKLINKILDEIK